MKELSIYRNGNYDVYLFDDGTKIRHRPDEVPDDQQMIPAFPESIDLKISNRCDIGCPQCHEKSVPNGELADLNDPVLNTLHAGTELAIGGGNPLEHPDLDEFLLRMKRQGVIVNMTVHLDHFISSYDRIKQMYENKFVYGVGISVNRPVSLKEIEMIKSIDNVVIHLIAGLVTNDTLASLMGRGMKILILGYKRFGRGELLYERSSFIDEAIKRLADDLPSLANHFPVISFDNLAIRQLELRKLFSDDEWSEFYMGDDGQFTMYIDLVKREYAVSSTSKRHPILQDSIDKLFASVREEAKQTNDGGK